MPELSEYLTVKEVAELYRVTPRTVRRWADGGLLKVVRPTPGRVRFRREDLPVSFEKD